MPSGDEIRATSSFEKVGPHPKQMIANVKLRAILFVKPSFMQELSTQTVRETPIHNHQSPNCP